MKCLSDRRNSMKNKLCWSCDCGAAADRRAVLAEQAAGHATGPAPDPQQPAVTFRAEVNYVEVDARVVDAQGTLRLRR